MARPDWSRYIRQRAPAYGVDPQAALAVASVEGLSGRPGDQNTSFGPFQLHVGGALPAGRDRAWAESPQGIDYALSQIGGVSKGLTGRAAVENIVRRFERPADPSGEIARALSVFPGSGAPSSSQAAPAAPPPAPLPAGAPNTFWSNFRKPAAPRPAPQDFWATFNGKPKVAPPPASEPGPIPISQPRTVTQPPSRLNLGSGVTLQGVDPRLVAAVNAFAQGIGQPVTVTSGYRNRAKQAALYQRYLAGGNIAAKPGHSNHEFGRALDIAVGGRSVGLTPYARLLAKYGLHLSVPGDYPHVTLMGVNG